MIETLNFKQIRNSEHIQFNKAVLHVCEVHNPETLHIKAQFDALKETNDSMESVFKTARGNVITQEIITEDENRDRLTVGFTMVVTGYTNYYLPEKKEAAELILAHIKKYGNTIAYLNYVAETATLNDLIDGIEADTELTAAVTLLGLNDWITELKARNTEFNRLFELRAEKEAGKTKLKLRELRSEAVVCYRNLIKYLDAASIMHPSDVYETVTNEINEFIDKYSNLRRKHKPGEDTEEPFDEINTDE